MSIRIGGIDPVQSVIDLELRIGILEKLISLATQRGLVLSQNDVDSAREKTMSELQSKYPQLGLEVKNAPSN